MTSDAAIPSKQTWREFVAHQSGRLIAAVGSFKSHLVRLERENAIDRIVVRDLAGEEHTVAFDEPAYALGLSGGYEYDTTLTRFVYQSPTTPRQTFDYDMASRERTCARRRRFPPATIRPATRRGGSTPRRPTAPSSRSPVLMLKGTPLDGSAPLMLYGYGAYGIPQEASFSIRNFSLVDRGWIWATAHIRGGSDKGWGWFLTGGASRRKIVSPTSSPAPIIWSPRAMGTAGRVAAYGGSAGGLLMGAIANLRPELWGAIIAAVPFVDVLTP